MMGYVWVSRGLVVVSVVVSVCWLGRIYQNILQLSPTQPTPTSSPTPNTTITTITTLLLISNTPSKLLPKLPLQIPTKPPQQFPQISTIYVWILQPASAKVEEEKYLFVDGLDNLCKVQGEVVFVQDYVDVGIQEEMGMQEGMGGLDLVEDRLRNLGLYFDQMDMIVIDATLNAELRDVFVKLVQENQAFVFDQQPDLIVAVKENRQQQDNEHCKKTFDEILQKSAVRLTASTPTTNLIYSPKTKTLQPLQSRISPIPLLSYLQQSQTSTLYLPPPHNQSQQQSITQLLLALLSSQPTKLEVLVGSGDWLRNIRRNLVLNDLDDHRVKGEQQGDRDRGQGDVWRRSGVVGLYGFQGFQMDLPVLRNRIISEKLKVIVYAKLDNPNIFDHIKSEFSVINIGDKYGKEQQKYKQPQAGLFLIQKGQTRKQPKQILSTPQQQFYKFTPTGLTPVWQKTAQAPLQLNHCFIKKFPEFAQYFFDQSSRELYLEILKLGNDGNDGNVGILWCCDEEYQLFYYIGKYMKVDIGYCGSMSTATKRKLRKISILHDFGAKVTEQQAIPYNLIFVDQSHKQEIRNAYNHNYKIIYKSSEPCPGARLSTYCSQDI